jgi:hypothetical protein
MLQVINLVYVVLWVKLLLNGIKTVLLALLRASLWFNEIIC